MSFNSLQNEVINEVMELNPAGESEGDFYYDLVECIERRIDDEDLEILAAHNDDCSKYKDDPEKLKELRGELISYFANQCFNELNAGYL